MHPFSQVRLGGATSQAVEPPQQGSVASSRGSNLQSMRFLVLGPLEVIGEGGQPLPISGSKERTILADLIAHAGRVVPLDDLIEEIWGGRPPRTAEKTLGSYISRLRRALEPVRSAGSSSDVIATRGGGYVLAVAADEIDAIRFEQLAGEGRELLVAGRSKEAGSALEEALGLWRGRAYQDYRYGGFGASEGDRLEELLRSAREDWVDTRLAAGDAAVLIADLEAMVHEEPLRERRWGQLMLSLYRARRQAEALQAFTRARTVLVDELGIEPGPDLQHLQAAILAQDPKLHGRLSSAVVEPMSSTDVCPYKGLARFEQSDAEFYFGREQVVADAVGRLVGGRFLALVGASGSGKSSLLRAGLLHALTSGAIPGSDRWQYALMRPGDRPLEALKGALEASAPPATANSDGDRFVESMAVPGSQKRLVLAVDQFEETFTACTDDSERTAFLDSITEAVLVRDGGVTVVLAIRADYYGRCADHRELASLLAASQILVGPMKEDELRRAIQLPAEQGGLRIEDRLTEALVTHTVNQPGGLPLLSTALLELWTRRRGRTLHVEDYLHTGGVEGAITRLAEDAFGRLDEKAQAAAKRILLRLAGSSEGREVVARTASLSELGLDRDADASRALAALAGARLVTVAEGTAEVAHEALLRDWPRLRTWLEDDAEGRRLHRHITESAHAWEEGGRDDGDLYRGARLTSALEWAETHDADPNELEWQFLRRGRAASEGETVRVRRANRRMRGLLAGVAVLLVLSLIVGNLALRQRDAYRAAADVADSRQLAAASLSEKDGILSLLLAREAVALDHSAQTRSALLAALQREPAAIAVMHADGAVPGDLTEWLKLSPDGRILATGGARPTVDLFDAATYRALDEIDVGSGTTAGDFSADSETLAVAAVNRRIVGIDMRSRTVRASVTTNGRNVDAILFTPDGGLLTAESIRQRGFLVPRKPLTLETSGVPVRSRSGPITAMDSSADGRWVVTTGLPPDLSNPGGHTALWNARDLKQVGSAFPVGGNDIAMSSDGWTAAIAAAESGSHNEDDDLKGHLVLLNLRTGQQHISREGRAPGLSGPPIGLTGVAFSADGRSVISTGDDDRVLIWDASSATIEEAFDDPSGLVVFTPAPSPDGSTAFTIDLDGNVAAWDLRGDQRIGRSFIAGSGQTNGGPFFAISPDGTMLALIQASWNLRHGSIRLIDTSTRSAVGLIPFNYPQGPYNYPQALAFSPDSQTLAVTSHGGYVQLWDIHTHRPVGRPFRVPVSDAAPRIFFWAAGFSPNGSVLATGGGVNFESDSSLGVVFLWDVATGRLIGRLPEQAHVSAVSFTPDGALLVVSTGFGEGGGEVIVWNVDDGRVERRIQADDTGVLWVDLSNEGTTLATAGSDGERLWDLSTGEPIGPTFIGGGGFTVDLSPNGRTLVAAGRGRATMWDVATGSVLGLFPGLAPKDTLAAAFTPDGRRLFVVSNTGQAWVWDVDPASWESRACQVAGRSLTQTEWELYLPDRPYQATCGS